MNRLRRLALYLLAGLLATDVAITASLLVDGVTAKRITAVMAGVVVAVAAGIAVAIRTPDPQVRGAAVSPRVRAAGPWLIVATVIAAIVCAAGWPVPTGWAVGAVVGAAALVAGVRLLLEEQRPRSSTGANSSTRPQCAGCAGCGGPDCAERPDELTAEEARALVDELGLQLYRAEDALAYVAEMCDIADEHRGKRGEPATVTTTRVREWLRGAQCARQAGLILPAGWLRARADRMEQP